MTWLDSFFQAVKEIFSWKRQTDDPETIRLKKIREIDGELDELQDKLNKLIATEVTEENEEQLAIDLGVIIHDILELRRERRTLTR